MEGSTAGRLPEPAAPGRRRVSDADEDSAAAVLRLTDRLSAAELLGLQSHCDTALIWALVLKRLRLGERPGAALAATVNDIIGAAAAPAGSTCC